MLPRLSAICCECMQDGKIIEAFLPVVMVVNILIKFGPKPKKFSTVVAKIIAQS